MDIGGGNTLKCSINAAGSLIRSKKLTKLITMMDSLVLAADLNEDGTLYLRVAESNINRRAQKTTAPHQQGAQESVPPAGRPEKKQLQAAKKNVPVNDEAAFGELNQPGQGNKQHQKEISQTTYQQINLFEKDETVSQPRKPDPDRIIPKKVKPKLINHPIVELSSRAKPIGAPKAPPAKPEPVAPKLQSRPLQKNPARESEVTRVALASNLMASPTVSQNESENTRVAQASSASAEAKPMGLPLVKISRNPEEDATVLQLAETKSASTSADFYLHRQALALLLSPGFDTLLAINAARDIQLLDYQLATVRHVLKNLRGRALLCDEVGLGKTIEAGLIMMEYILRGLVRRVLILTPPSLVEQWQEEMQVRFNLDFVTYDSPTFKSTPQPWTNIPRIIASIDTAKRDRHQDMVLEPVYDLVIVDEAHHLKKQRTQAYQFVSRLKKKYILLLTATPVENNLEELFNLITLLQPGHLETATNFKKKYITRGNPLQPKNADDLKKLVREVMVRNRRSETGVIKARRHAEVVEVALSTEEAAFYRRLTSFVRGYYTPDSPQISGGVNRFVLKMLQREVGSSIEAVLPTLEKIAAGPNHPAPVKRLAGALAGQAETVPRRAKAETLLRLLQRIPGKVIIFTGFRETQRFLANLLRQEGLAVAELHGGMRRAEKEEHVRSFAASAQVLVSTETGSEGRNLQFCNVLINYDLPWNPMRIEQRIGRIHRLGQEQDVYIYNLSAPGTVEAHILELLDAKINMFQLVVGELDMILGNLQEKRDLEDIIMDIWTGTTDDASLKAGIDELGERLIAAKKHYLAVKDLDDRLLGELLPEE